MFDPSAIATHNAGDPQDTPAKYTSFWAVTVQADAPPAGLVELATSCGPTATQNETDGHDTADKPSNSGSTWVTVHADAPPAGFPEVTTLPALSTATHKDTDGHEIPIRATVPVAA